MTPHPQGTGSQQCKTLRREMLLNDACKQSLGNRCSPLSGFVCGFSFTAGHDVVWADTIQGGSFLRALEAVPDGDSMAPPQLPGNAPIPDVLQPSVVDLLESVGNNSYGPIGNSLQGLRAVRSSACHIHIIISVRRNTAGIVSTDY